MRGRHAACYLALAEAAAPALLGPEQPAWLGRLDGRARTTCAPPWPGAWTGAPGPALRLAGWLWPFWRMRQHYAEGADWLARALAAAPAPGRTADWARAALGAGILARDRGDLAAARAHLEASLACSRALGEPGLVGLGPARPGRRCTSSRASSARPRACWRRGWPWRGPPATGAARRPP